jgi:DNA-binding transcriptional ArsR family regulator
LPLLHILTPVASGGNLDGPLIHTAMFCYLANMQNDETTDAHHLHVLKALASDTRLSILDWLKDPVAHFPPQTDGDLIQDGVCADFIREKLDIAAATASRHLTLLTDAGLLIATRKKGWTFYRRDERAIQHFMRQLQSHLLKETP